MATKISNWRTEPYFVNQNQCPTNSLPLSTDREKYVTCLATSDVTSMVAIGAGSRKNNLFLVQDDSSELTWKSTFTTPSPIYSLSWSGNYMLSGHWDGLISLLKPPMDYLLSDPNNLDPSFETRLLIKTQYKHRLNSGNSLNTRITKVEFSTKKYQYPSLPSTNQFNSLFNDGLYVWDVINSKTPVLFEKNSCQLIDSSWETQVAEDPKLIAVVDSSNKLKIKDIRTENGFAWEGLHQIEDKEALTSVKWSPFVPYWVATADVYGTVYVWDLRYSKSSLAQLTGSTGAITSLDWSNTHTEALIAASDEGACYMYNLAYHNSHQPTESISTPNSRQGLVSRENRPFTSALATVRSSNVASSRFYAVSEVGEVAYLESSPSILETVTPHRVDLISQPELYKCETAVYQRDLKLAGELLSQLLTNKDKVDQYQMDLLADSMLGNSSDTKIEFLKKFTLPKAEDLKELDLVRERFNNEVETLSYTVPTNFTKVQPKVVTSVDERFKKLHQSTFPKIVKDKLAKDDLQPLLKMEKEIISYFVSSFTPSGVTLIIDIIRALLPKYCSQSLELTIKLINALFEANSNPDFDFEPLTPLVYLVFYPTVFDADPFILASVGVSRTNSGNRNRSGSTGSGSRPTTPPNRPSRSASRNKAPLPNPQKEGPGRESVISPTSPIRSENSPISAQKHLAGLIKTNPKDILSMIQLEIDIQDIAIRCGSDSEKAAAVILHAMTKRFQSYDLANPQPCHFTVSSGALKLFLNATVQLKRYEQYLEFSAPLCQAFPTCDLARLIINQAHHIVVPKFKAKLDSLLKDTESDLDPKLGPLNCIITLVLRDNLTTPGQSDHKNELKFQLLDTCILFLQHFKNKLNKDSRVTSYQLAEILQKFKTVNRSRKVPYKLPSLLGHDQKVDVLKQSLTECLDLLLK